MQGRGVRSLNNTYSSRISYQREIYIRGLLNMAGVIKCNIEEEGKIHVDAARRRCDKNVLLVLHCIYIYKRNIIFPL